jgi:ABC-type Fe3+/spermidine/putrescine transport system ATPase subunit
MKVDNGGSLIEMRGGLQIYTHDKTLDIGTKVVLAVRRENTRVDPVKEVESNSFFGSIEAASFVGDSIEYKIRLENNVEVSSKILVSHADKAYKPGDRVVFSFPPEKCYVFRYPTIGLLREIEAI